MKKITIAIDGFSSTGKSTLAKQLAQALGYVYVDTGAMYRAVTLFAMQRGFINREHFDPQSLIEVLDEIELEFKFNSDLGYGEIFLNGVNAENAIRTLEVSGYVSQIAALPQVRKKLVVQQQAFGRDKAVVMDGRDIGTVVFQNAELKVFMTASPEIRAQRRFDELIQKGQQVSLDEVYNNVVERDRIDTSRADSPLIQAEDAVVFDNSNIGRMEQFDQIYQMALDRIAAL